MLVTDILQERGIYTASSPTTVCSGGTNTWVRDAHVTSSLTNEAVHLKETLGK